MDDVSFIGVIKDSVSALKIDGGGNGGEITIQVPEIHLPALLHMSLRRKMLLQFTVKVLEGNEA